MTVVYNSLLHKIMFKEMQILFDNFILYIIYVSDDPSLSLKYIKHHKKSLA